MNWPILQERVSRPSARTVCANALYNDAAPCQSDSVEGSDSCVGLDLLIVTYRVW